MRTQENQKHENNLKKELLVPQIIARNNENLLPDFSFSVSSGQK
jgi:hypothetical protein